jgi:hypothetical protein
MFLTLQDYKDHLPANTISDSAKFEAFAYRALYRYFPEYLGSKLVNDIADESASPELMEIVKPALVNFSYLESVPFFNLVLTSTGYGIVSNPNIAPASMERVNALKDSCLEAANAGLSNILDYLEINNPPDWNKSCLMPGSLIPDTNTFIEATSMHITKLVFVQLIPHIRSFVNIVVNDAISNEFTTELAAGTDNTVKPLIQSSIAFGAYHKLFYKQKFNNQGNPVQQDNKYMHVALSYLNRAIALLAKNLDDYPTYKTHGYEAPYDNADTDSEMFFIGGPTA